MSILQKATPHKLATIYQRLAETCWSRFRRWRSLCDFAMFLPHYTKSHST